MCGVKVVCMWISGWTGLSSSCKKVLWMIEGYTLVLWLPMSHNISSKRLLQYEHDLSHICLGNSLFCLKRSQRNGIFKYEKIPLRNRGWVEKLIIKSMPRISKMWPSIWKMFTFNWNEFLKEGNVLFLPEEFIAGLVRYLFSISQLVFPDRKKNIIDTVDEVVLFSWRKSACLDLFYSSNGSRDDLWGPIHD